MQHNLVSYVVRSTHSGSTVFRFYPSLNMAVKKFLRFYNGEMEDAELALIIRTLSYKGGDSFEVHSEQVILTAKTKRQSNVGN